MENPGGLTGVWAEEHTRASLWDAMYRKETFGVSGPHIKVRFFGGWGYSEDTLNGRDWVKKSYCQRSPYGRRPASQKGKAPTFVVWAVKDPTTPISIASRSSRAGRTRPDLREDVTTLSGRGIAARSVTGKVPAIQTRSISRMLLTSNSIGAVELKTVWTDPEFDPSLDSFYYARVLQIPTPRWTTYDAKKLGVPPPSDVPPTVQERAWTSPIWYSPTEEARKNASPVSTVADLRAKGRRRAR